MSFSLISEVAGFFIPFLLGVYWAPVGIDLEIKATILRCVIAGLATLMLVVWLRAPLTRAETTFAALFGLLALLLIVPSLTATDPARAFKDLLKLVLLFAAGLAMARALRHERTARGFGYGMLLGSTVTAVLILSGYIRHMGLTLPTYEGLRILKEVLSRGEGFPLNPISFSAFFMYLIGLCLAPPRALTWFAGLFVFAVSSFLTGSRAPLAILLLSAVVATALHWVGARSFVLRVSGSLTLLLLTGVILASAFTVDSRKMVTISEGRTVAWSVAWSKFLERPFTGYGYESWRDDLTARLAGGEYFHNSNSLMKDGGYHNQYITLLAEEGLVGFVPAMAIVCMLLRCCRWLAWRTSIPAISRHMILLGGLFMFLRAAVEVPGLFGYANDPADYLAYCFVAVVVSRMSLHEDKRRPTLGRFTSEPQFSMAVSA
ncbi:MAG: O-antigen ligase family protein [Acidobacteria bacterium]|nr:O-antigen ligase family protein [Acidobacteriota bacterium]MBV9624278.1 O-antigen ligase family protein [Acidobacteriota bacterium]